MSEVKLIVRDAFRDLSITCHGSCAERVVAALSADPVTIEELKAALQRFEKLNAEQLWGWAIERIDAEPWDAGLVIIDLAARLVADECSYFCAASHGWVSYHNGDCATNTVIGYRLADDWLFLEGVRNWELIAEERRRENAQRHRIDAREVLYGRPLLEHIASECWMAFLQLDEEVQNSMGKDPPTEDEQPEESPAYRTVKKIHADWLMTPREDLLGRTPRQVLLADRARLAEDMQHRRNQWARLHECPRGLDRNSHAFRYAGFGSHEIVKYYDFVRELLWSCWERLSELAADLDGRLQLHVEGTRAFVANEVVRLEQFAQEWLMTADPECHFRTPRDIIDRERARIPETVSGREAMVDPDCPCCQMLAELPGPTFLHLDGSNMDDEFAFDYYHLERETWEAEQLQWREEARELTPNNADSEARQLELASSVWSRSFSMAESADLPLGVRLLGIAWHVAELVMELNEISDSQQLIDQLHRDLRNLREVLCGAEESRLDSLVEPVLDRFVSTLDTVAVERPDLEPRCSDLIRKVESLRQRPVISDG